MTDPKTYRPQDVEALLDRLDEVTKEALSEIPLESALLSRHVQEAADVLRGKALPGSPKLAVQEYLRSVRGASPQQQAWDRNSWQRRLGAVVTYIEETCRHADEHSVEVDPAELLTTVYKIINTNPLTQTIDDPYADIASMATRETLAAAIEAGLVMPGPKWTQAESQQEVARKTSEKQDR